MKRLIVVLVITAVLAVCWSCSDPTGGGGGDTPDNSVMALSPGNVWVYERELRSGPQDLFSTDTVTVRVLGRVNKLDGEWYVIDGAWGRQYWRNQPEGLWACRGDGGPFLLFSYPPGSLYDWYGPDSMSTIQIIPGVGCYGEVPAKGWFRSQTYVEHFVSDSLGIVGYQLAPGLGILESDRSLIDPVTQVSYQSERYTLIDYAVVDPPIDTGGTIAFYYHLPAPGLPASSSFRVNLSLDAPPFGATWYGFFPAYGPDLPVGGCCPMWVGDVPDSGTYTHRVEVMHVPRGWRDMRVTLVYNGGFDTVGVAVVDSIRVDSAGVTELGSILAY